MRAGKRIKGGKGRVITLYFRALIDIERDAVKNAVLNWSLLAVFQYK